ncbi:MAG: hypothetical protein FWG20_03940 [Candidatus Cloacimonetes bacterium]|nr:hypothetical protein [Candidatus Cloacimonadota bacterium]
MPIDKYLSDIETPDFTPGPFALRLKYEMKQVIFYERNKPIYHIVYTAAIISLTCICFLLVLKPTTAQSLNQIVFKHEILEDLDLIYAEESDVDLSKYATKVNAVTNDTNVSFPFIEEDKSYLVHKFRNHENKMLIYFSEVRKPQTTKVLH